MTKDEGQIVMLSSASSAITLIGIRDAAVTDDDSLWELAERVADMYTASRWARGDITDALLSHLEENADDPEYWETRKATMNLLSALFGVSQVTLLQDRSTIRAWPIEERVPGMSFTHHRALNPYIETLGLEACRDMLLVMLDEPVKPPPELVAYQLKQLTSDGGKPSPRRHDSRQQEFETWFYQATGLDVEAEEDHVTIPTSAGAWHIAAVLDRARPALDIRFQEVES